MAQFARPDSNVAQTNVTGGFADIDEVTASDADFAYSTNNTTAELEVGLSDVTDPASGSGHWIRFRYAKTNAGVPDSGGSDGTVQVILRQGSFTQIVAGPVLTVSSGTWSLSTLNLSVAQADAITDYTDLRLEFALVGGGGSPANRRGVGVSWAEMEVPDANNNVTVTPATASLVLTTFAPTATASDHKTVVPGVTSLALTTFAPSAVIGNIVVPTTASLSLATFAPSVSVSDNQTVTPGVASLALTTFAPTVSLSDNKLVTPDVAALVLSAFAPTVTASDHKIVTPDVASLVLTTFAPTVTGGAGLTVIPSTASLVMTAFAPDVVVTDHKLVTPGVASLSLAAFAPTVTASDHKTVTPGSLALVLTTFAPIVTAGGAGSTERAHFVSWIQDDIG